MWKTFIVALCVVASLLPTQAQSAVRALKQVSSTSELGTTELVANSGWQTIYTQRMRAAPGDVLRLIGQIQLTVDSAPLIGQQLRLTVDGQPVGTHVVEINTQPGSHHLPMMVTGLYLAPSDGEVVIRLEGSSFHTDGDFLVSVDHAANLFYGSLLVEQFRTYPDLAAAWADGALLLTEIHQPPALAQPIWGQAPYAQEPLGALRIPANAGDVLRPAAQAVGVGTSGLEQFTGVLTLAEQPISPYGGQNVVPENFYAPMLIEGFHKVAKDGQQFLEHRIYGAFAHGLTIFPDSAQFEVAQYSNYGRGLERFGQESIAVSLFPANSEPVEVYAQELELAEGDLLHLTASLQFAQPDSPVPVTAECGMVLSVTGPEGSVSSASRKNITPTKAVLPLTRFLTARAPVAGRYRISLKASGRCDAGPIAMRLDGNTSQLQFLQFGLPR